MDKLKVTQKEMKEKCFKNELISISYCSLQTLLRFEQPFAYSVGIYGWSCDYYKLNNFIISTGYASCGQDVPNSIIKKYEKKAKNIYFDVKNQRKRSKKNIDNFTNELQIYFSVKSLVEGNNSSREKEIFKKFDKITKVKNQKNMYKIYSKNGDFFYYDKNQGKIR